MEQAESVCVGGEGRGVGETMCCDCKKSHAALMAGVMCRISAHFLYAHTLFLIHKRKHCIAVHPLFENLQCCHARSMR